MPLAFSTVIRLDHLAVGTAIFMIIRPRSAVDAQRWPRARRVPARNVSSFRGRQPRMDRVELEKKAAMLR
jgi:hypothetical protein